VEVRATVWVATAGVLAGELAAPGLSPPVLFGVACALAIVWLAGRRRSAAVAWSGLAAMALGVGAERMSAVSAPEFPPDHVARLALPLNRVALLTVAGQLSTAGHSQIDDSRCAFIRQCRPGISFYDKL